MKIVISLGGICFKDAKSIRRVAEVIEEIAKSHSVYVVTGGGENARTYIKIAHDLGANDAVCDYIGIEVTRLNARLLIAALHNAYPKPFTDYKDVDVATLGENKIAVLGGVSPGYSTDAVAAILAEYLNAELIINATSVNGVYDEDPRIEQKARKYDKITPKELVSIAIKTEMKAGSRNVIDAVAAKIIERSRIKTIVIDGNNPKNILGAVHGKHKGTEILS